LRIDAIRLPFRRVLPNLLHRPHIITGMAIGSCVVFTDIRYDFALESH